MHMTAVSQKRKELLSIVYSDQVVGLTQIVHELKSLVDETWNEV